MSPHRQAVIGIDVGGERKGFHAVALRNGVFEKATSTKHAEIVSCLLMFEKEIILKEQLAVRCLLQCSPARKLPANAGTLDY